MEQNSGLRWILSKRGNVVTIQFPVINFQTGPVSPEDPYYPAAAPFPGGYLYTSDGFLPENICPNDLVYRSIVAASNNGASLPFSFDATVNTLPVPPVGYILSITNAGAISGSMCRNIWQYYSSRASDSYAS